MPELVRVGMVGLGTIARTHYEVLVAVPDVALDFTVDPHVEEPPAFRETRPPHYARLTDALTAHAPDLIVIATPTSTHAEQAIGALTHSSARILVEKPLVHDSASLARIQRLDDAADVAARVFTAHHFAFSPEVRWAAQQIAEHPEWGPITGITSAFHDPYISRGTQAFASYGSSWMDSGVNQLSMLTRLVHLTEITSARQLDDGASAWCVCAYRHRGRSGEARLRSSWLTGSSSKGTMLFFSDSGVELWLDHTAMTGFCARGSSLISTHGNDGRTPRKVAHYRPLYESLLSDRPDPVLAFATAATITQIHQAAFPED